MNYVLVEKKQLEEKGIFPFAELLPDGRAILPLNALKIVTGLTGIDVVDGESIEKLQEEFVSLGKSPIEDIHSSTEETEVFNG